MTATTDPYRAAAAETRADRIVAAYHTAQSALVELSDALHEGTFKWDDDAIDVGYAIAYSSDTVDSDGVPDPRIGRRHGDGLLLLSATIRDQIGHLVELSHEVPSYITEEIR